MASASNRLKLHSGLVSSPDLIPGITDEFALGIPYEKLDLILSGLDTNMAMKDIAAETGVKQKTIEYVKELVRRSEHMRISPLVPDQL